MVWHPTVFGDLSLLTQWGGVTTYRGGVTPLGFRGSCSPLKVVRTVYFQKSIKFENSGLLCWPPAARGQLKMIPKVDK